VPLDFRIACRQATDIVGVEMITFQSQSESW
jgi:hypothetical protein